jgi:hypothetical protein
VHKGVDVAVDQQCKGVLDPGYRRQNMGDAIELDSEPLKPLVVFASIRCLKTYFDLDLVVRPAQDLNLARVQPSAEITRVVHHGPANV